MASDENGTEKSERDPENDRGPKRQARIPQARKPGEHGQEDTGRGDEYSGEGPLGHAQFASRLWNQPDRRHGPLFEPFPSDEGFEDLVFFLFQSRNGRLESGYLRGA